MMQCKSCQREIQEGSAYCNWCGKKQKQERRNTKKRGNGQGSVYKTPSGKYKAVVVTGYYTDENGRQRKKTRSKTFDKMKDAVAALPAMKAEPSENAKKKTETTFKELYDKWLPTHRAGKSTLDCYKAAMKYFSPVLGMKMQDIDIDDLQECVDSCGHGKRTQQNMKAVCGLVYKYGIPRGAIPGNLNLAQYLLVSGEGAYRRASFTDVEIEMIKKAVGTVPYADYIYCMIYLGFRPSEFLELAAESYDKERVCFVGGGKTQAGTNRLVTVSPKILPIVKSIADGKACGPLFSKPDGKPWKLQEFTDNCFYPALDAIGIENPMVDIAGGERRHKYTPHSCRHTFSTLMKRVDAPSKDKLELIGHSSEEMLRYYQDVNIDDLKKITDAI